MNPIDFAARVLRDVYGNRLTDPDAVAAPDPDPFELEDAQCLRAGVQDALASHSVYRPEPMYVTGFEPAFRARAADEALVLERLAVETAARGSWEAARTLFAPDAPCAGLYATQTPPDGPSRVSVSPDAHRPAQPLP